MKWQSTEIMSTNTPNFQYKKTIRSKLQPHVLFLKMTFNLYEIHPTFCLDIASLKTLLNIFVFSWDIHCPKKSKIVSIKYFYMSWTCDMECNVPKKPFSCLLFLQNKMQSETADKICVLSQLSYVWLKIRKQTTLYLDKS